MNIITCVAPVNIAVIKYWGKKSDDLIIPLNDSLSSTLSTEHLRTKTTVMAHPDFKENKIWINGKEESFDNPRLQNCLQEIRKKAKLENEVADLYTWNIHVCSENNFPTAAGLASSASGYACLEKFGSTTNNAVCIVLVYAIAQLYSIKSDISGIARLGSGSACRSIPGGWVRWYSGVLDNGFDSIAKQILPSSYWSEMRILILVVKDCKKEISSKSGMKATVLTSELLKHRTEKCVPNRIEKIIQALKERDFTTFAKITMQDSNQFHAVCLDTYPPCVYMNDTSHTIASVVHKFNEIAGAIKVAYTFDAGPNPCLYLLKETVSTFLSVINYFFPPGENRVEYIKGIPVDTEPLNEDLIKKLPPSNNNPGVLKYIIHTKVGEGPNVVIEPNEHLLNEQGLPKNTQSY